MVKTPEEIKKGLGCCARLQFPNAYCDNCPYLVKAAENLWECKSPEILTDALAYIQQLEDQIRDLTKKVPKWISVEEKKPKRGEYVLFLYAKGAQNPVMHAKNPMVVGRYDYGMYLANGCEVKITHWMPLPESPKEG